MGSRAWKAGVVIASILDSKIAENNYAVWQLQGK